MNLVQLREKLQRVSLTRSIMAAKITGMISSGDTYLLRLEEIDYNVKVNEAWMNRYDVKVGGYILLLNETYLSYMQENSYEDLLDHNKFRLAQSNHPGFVIVKRT